MTGTDMKIETQQLLASHRAGVLRPVADPGTAAGLSNVGSRKADTGFSKLLEERLGEVRISAHAATRLKSRNIDLTPEMMEKLGRAVDGAAAKGAKDSLVLMKNYAFIVNIPSRMVVTAMDGNNLKKNVFTNIDSAVVAD